MFLSVVSSPKSADSQFFFSHAILLQAITLFNLQFISRSPPTSDNMRVTSLYLMQLVVADADACLAGQDDGTCNDNQALNLLQRSQALQRSHGQISKMQLVGEGIGELLGDDGTIELLADKAEEKVVDNVEEKEELDLGVEALHCIKVQTGGDSER